ncbi:hypothetical protein [Paracoccus spongiarum]|uniref:Uncharacterized protein n=1 Tax=Paracoccus spongiarum TaxID=3064387 RepID=A0ABT9JFQ5_9RHOB|nr:hypothetical protein [Paracoccus sp. 2205BS29-5]MDP5308676.1 hypothetical protein [Paracoccus sp. 2205BS29-5]
MNAMTHISETERGDVTETTSTAGWRAQCLAEARGIVADFVHHPDSLIVLACRAIAAHSPEDQERREALALAGLLIAVSNRGDA